MHDQPATPGTFLDHGLHFHCNPHGAKRLEALVEMIAGPTHFRWRFSARRCPSVICWDGQNILLCRQCWLSFPFAASCLQGHIRFSLYAMPRARQDMCITKQKATTKFKQILQRPSMCGKHCEGSHMSKNKARLATSLHRSTSPAPVRVTRLCSGCSKRCLVLLGLKVPHNPMPNISDAIFVFVHLATQLGPEPSAPCTRKPTAASAGEALAAAAGSLLAISSGDPKGKTGKLPLQFHLSGRPEKEKMKRQNESAITPTIPCSRLEGFRDEPRLCLTTV